MAKVIYMEDIISKNRHLENQDVFEISSRANGIGEISSGIRHGMYRISPRLISAKPDPAVYHEYSKPRLDLAKDILDKWKFENRLNLKIRKDLAQQIEIDDHGIRIGSIYWEFSYIFQDTLEKGEKYLKKFRLKVPSVNDLDSSALLLPGDCIEDKRSNLLLLLGFIVNTDNHCKIWTSTRQNLANTNDIALDSNIGEIINIVKTKMKSFLGINNKLAHLLYHYGTGIAYYEASHNEVGNICGIRKLNNI